MKKIKTFMIATCAYLLVWLVYSSSAFAETGVPMLAMIWPAACYLLLPIVALETWIACLIIGKENLLRNLIASAVVNTMTTLIGIPLCWGAFVAIEVTVPIPDDLYGVGTFWGKVLSVTHQAGWLLPYETQMYWMIPVATMVLLVPIFFFSVYTERVGFRLITHCSREQSRRWSWVANGATYGLIFLVLIGLLIYGIFQKG